ncbi:4912_t:CDS:1, partial [Gigaspora rosea]
ILEGFALLEQRKHLQKSPGYKFKPRWHKHNQIIIHRVNKNNVICKSDVSTTSNSNNICNSENFLFDNNREELTIDLLIKDYLQN